MFVWANNSNKFLVNERGKVKDHFRRNITPKRDLEGFLYVEYGTTRYYVHELVIQNHGKPPNQNRLPKPDEVPVFLDGDPENVHITNLEYRKKGTDMIFRKEKHTPKAVEDFVWELLKQGKTYNQIQEEVANRNYSKTTISFSTIGKIRKQRTKKESKDLTPADKVGLEAVKKSLKITDDTEARLQMSAEQDAKEREEARKEHEEKKAKEEAEQKSKEENLKRLNKNKFRIENSGTGWYDVFQGEKRLNGKKYREKDAKTMLKVLREGGKEADQLLDALKHDRETYEPRK